MKHVTFLFIIFGVLVTVSCEKHEDLEYLSPRLVFVGFDSASWHIMDPLLKKGLLPNISKLIKEGVRANLKTLKPTLSPMIWATINTGMLPTKHGITGFLNNRKEVYISRDLKQKPLWEILSSYNVPSTVINFWLTWPADPMPNHRMVSERFLFNDLENIVYPTNILNDIDFRNVAPQKYMDNFITYPDGTRQPNSNNVVLSTYIHYLRDSLLKDEMCRKTGLSLYKSFETGLFAIYFRYLDIVQHVFWQFMETFPEDANQDLVPYLKNVIPVYYQYYDGIIGDFLKETKENTIFIIVSDHGASSAAAERRTSNPTTWKKKPILVATSLNLKRFRPDINCILHWLGYLEYNTAGEIDHSKTAIYDSNSLAVSWDERILAFNTNKKSSNKDQDKKFKSKLQTKIIRQLLSLKTENSGKNIFKVVKPATEGILCHFTADLTPDTSLMIRNKTHMLNQCGVYTGISGAHTLGPDGIIILSGDPIRKGVILPSARVQDVTPTILYLMGIPVSREMDGKVFLDAITPEFVETRSPRYVDSHGPRNKPVNHKTNPEVDKEILEQLKNLGYLK